MITCFFDRLKHLLGQNCEDAVRKTLDYLVMGKTFKLVKKARRYCLLCNKLYNRLTAENIANESKLVHVEITLNYLRLQMALKKH